MPPRLREIALRDSEGPGYRQWTALTDNRSSRSPPGDDLESLES